MNTLTDLETEEIIKNLHSFYDKIHFEFMESAKIHGEGKIRYDAGDFIERILQKLFDEINLKRPEKKIISKVGKTDFLSKKVLYKGKEYVHDEIQVDRHIWLEGERIAFIENKTYLDACYFSRALADFRKIAQSEKQRGKNPEKCKYIVFAGQRALKEERRLIDEADFWDDTKHLTEDNSGIEPYTFFIFKGKRSPQKPLHKIKHELDDKEIYNFIKLISEIAHK